jgi:hypothetical protein
VIFGVGIGIVIQQTGFPFLLESPEHPSVPALVVGALFCNGPVMLKALALRFGGGSSSLPSGPSEPALPSEPSPEPLSGAN